MEPLSMNGNGLPLADPLYDTKGAAAYLGVSPKTLERYRFTGTPSIPFIKFSDRRNAPVRYRKSALDSFLQGTVRTSTQEYVR